MLINISGKYAKLLDGTIWAITPEALAAAIEALEISGANFRSTANTPLYTQVNNTAVIPIVGIITQRASFWSTLFGDPTADFIAAAIDAAVADNSISSIVLDVDSPGGSVYGMAELSQKIYEARSQKPIYAVTNSLMASAAYWIGSSAKKVYITPSGEAGSVGVIAIHADYSRMLDKEGVSVTIIKAGEHKSEGNPYQPLGDDAQQYIQGRVDDYYSMFVKSVARNRGVAPSQVKNNFGGGRVLGAKAAVAAGMADGVKMLSEVLAMAGKKLSTKAYAQSKLAVHKQRSKSHAACGDAS